MIKLTPRQQEILDFIKSTIEVLGAPPTRVEISTAFGFASPNAAEEHLKALARKGAIVLEAGAARGIRLVEQLGLPLIGSVAAGSPILAVENIQGRYQVDPNLFSPKPDYLLKVRGNSMIDAGIFDGDLLAVHRTAEARNGQIVVARLDEDVTVKRYQKRGRTVELIAENADYAPIVVDPERQALEIEGLAVGLIRGSQAL
jgi:repressor LexA